MRLSAIMTDAERHAAYAENAALLAQKERQRDKIAQDTHKKRLKRSQHKEITQAEIAKINTEIDRVNAYYDAFDRKHPEIAAERDRRWHEIQRNSVTMSDDELRDAIADFDRWRAETYGMTYDAQLMALAGDIDLTSVRDSREARLAAPKFGALEYESGEISPSALQKITEAVNLLTTTRTETKRAARRTHVI